VTILICAVSAAPAPVMHLPVITVRGRLEFAASVPVQAMNRCVWRGRIARSGSGVADA
jgi:hypothetical protein